MRWGTPTERARTGPTALLAVLAAAAVVAAGCGAGTGQHPAPPRATSSAGPVTTVAGLGPDVVVGSQGVVLEEGDGAILCNGGVAESAPPQCDGPVIAGWDWDAAADAGIEIREQSGVRWADSAWLVGTLDGDTFTQTERPEPEAPESVVGRSEPMPPADCEDPWRGADEPTSGEGAEIEGMDEAMRLAADSDGFIGNQIDGNGSRFSVGLQSRVGEAGAEALLEQIREVYSGPVCLELREGPSAAELDELALSLAGDDTPWTTEIQAVDGELRAYAEVVDPLTKDLLIERVDGLVAPENLRLHGAYYVLGEASEDEASEDETRTDEPGDAAAEPRGSEGDGPTDPAIPFDIAPDAELVAHATVLDDGTGPELCLGMVLTSLPPQCGGASVIGWDWASVEHEERAGVRWGGYRLVGTYDRATFTLTEPPDDGSGGPDRAPSEEQTPWQEVYPALCTDPYRGGDEATAPLHPTDAVSEAILGLPGYVGHYVSDGTTDLNVVVQEGTDVEVAHTRVREVWAGFLCIEARDVPTDADQMAAQDAVVALGMADLGLLSVGGSLGVLSVHVALADEATVAAIHEAAAPWFTPEQIEITSALVPTTGD